MSDKTKIEWADATLNPAYGCSKVSPACDHCYAATMASRFQSAPGHPFVGAAQGGTWTGKFNLLPERMEQALRWKRPRRIFVGSMTDLFHDNVPDSFLDRVFAYMALAPQHTFMLLTKRPERMQVYMAQLVFAGRDLSECRRDMGMDLAAGMQIVAARRAGLPNVWLGVTAENQAMADKRIPVLLDTPAARRFVSVEPMLSGVDVSPWLPGSYECALTCGHRQGEHDLPARECRECGFIGPDDHETWGYGDNAVCPKCGEYDPEMICPKCGTIMVHEHPDTQCLDWVICGGESGPGARPMHPDWARALRDQCAAAGVPFLFKQWGECVDDHHRDRRVHIDKTFWMLPDGTTGEKQPQPDGCVWMARIGSRFAGRVLDGEEHNGFPEVQHG
jgi:protein gp37